MKGLNLKLLILAMMLMSVSLFSQNLQPKPINFENTDGVFVAIDLMDSITLKLIDRKVLIDENLTLAQIVDNLKSHNEELAIKSDLSNSKANDYKNLWQNTEQQKTLLFESLESQKLITRNVKKKPLEMASFILEEASRSAA